MYRRKFFIIILLVGITLLAFGFRLYRLDWNVPSLYVDELSGAQKMLFEMNQSTNNIWQWVFRQIHLRISTFVWFLGLTPLGVRLPAAIYGGLIPIAGYWMVAGLRNAKQVSLGRKVALITALLLAIVPWAFMVSRIGHTHVPLMVIFVCLSAGFYLRAKDIKGYLFSLFFLILATYYYPAVIVVSPFVLVVMGYEMWKGGDKKLIEFLHRSFLGKAGLVVTMGIILLIFLTKYHGLSMTGRGLDLAIWNDVNVTADTNLYRGLSRLSRASVFSFNKNPELGNHLVYNYPVAVTSQFVENYLSFFSPEWLFLKGDSVLRHSTGQVGVFYVWLLPFIVYGAYVFFRKADRKSKWLFGVWILASPVPAAITNDGAGYLLRVVMMLPFLTYFGALGLVCSLDLVKGKLEIVYKFFLLIISIYSVYYFLFGYFHVYPALSARSYEFGFKELAEFQMQNENKKMLVIWNGFYPSNYFRFWQKTSLDDYGQFERRKFVVGNSVFYQTFDNLYFGWPSSMNDLENFIGQEKVEEVVFPNEYLKNNPEYVNVVGGVVKTVLYPDKTVAFGVYGKILPK